MVQWELSKQKTEGLLHVKQMPKKRESAPHPTRPHPPSPHTQHGPCPQVQPGAEAPLSPARAHTVTTHEDSQEVGDALL